MKKLEKIQLPKEIVEAPLEEEVALTPVEPEEEKKIRFPKLAEWAEKIHVKPFPWKSINARNALVAGCLVIIAVAGYINVKYGIMPSRAVTDPVDAAEGPVAVETNFFASAIIDRERARGEALEVLVSITEDEGADEDAKTSAFTQMERIANETSWEIDIENLVKAKGFAECVAVINENSANIVVSSEGLTPAEIAQIKEIVYLQSEINPKDVKIIEKKPN